MAPFSPPLPRHLMGSSWLVVAFLVISSVSATSHFVVRDTFVDQTLKVSLAELVADVDASTFVIGPNVQFAPGANLEVVGTALPRNTNHFPSLSIEDCNFLSSIGGVIFSGSVANWHTLSIRRITASFVMFTNNIENVTTVAVTGSSFSAIGNGDHQAVSMRGGTVTRVENISVENNTFAANKGIDNYHSNIGILVVYGLPARGFLSISHIGSINVCNNSLRAVVRARPGFFGYVNVALRVRVAALIVDSPGSNVGIVNVADNVIFPDVHVLTRAYKQKSNGNKAGNAVTHCSTAVVNFFSNAWANLTRFTVIGNAIVDGQQIPASFAAPGGTVAGLLLGTCTTLGYLTVVSFQSHGTLNMAEFRIARNSIRNVSIGHQASGDRGRFTARYSAHYFVAQIGGGGTLTAAGLRMLVVENNTLESHSSPSDYFMHGNSGLLSVWSNIVANGTHFIVAGNALNVTGTIVQVVDWQVKHVSVSVSAEEPLLGHRPLLAVANNLVRVAVVDTATSLFAIVSTSTLRDLWGVAVVGNVVRAALPAFKTYTSRLLPASILAVNEALVVRPQRCDLQLVHVDVFNNAVDLETRTVWDAYYPSLMVFDTAAAGTVPIPITSTPCNYTRTTVRIVGNAIRHFADVQRHRQPAPSLPTPTRGSAISLPLRSPHSHLTFLSLNQFIGWNATGAPVVTNDARNHSFGPAAKFFWESNGPIGPMMRNESYVTDQSVRESLSTDPTRRAAEFPGVSHVFVGMGTLRRCEFDTQCSVQDTDASIGAIRDGGHCWCVCLKSRRMQDAWRIPPSLQCTLSESLASLPETNQSQAKGHAQVFVSPTKTLTASISVSRPPTPTHWFKSTSSSRSASTTSFFHPGERGSRTPTTSPASSSVSATARVGRHGQSLTLSVETHNQSSALSSALRPQIPAAVTTAAVSTARAVTGFGASLVGPSSVARAGRLGSSRRTLLCVFDPNDVAPPFAEQPVQFPLGVGAASEGFQQLAGASASSAFLLLVAASFRMMMFRLVHPGRSRFATTLSGVMAAVFNGFFIPALLGNAVLAAVHGGDSTPIVAACLAAAAVAVASFALDSWAVLRCGSLWRVVHADSDEVNGIYKLHDTKLASSSVTTSTSLQPVGGGSIPVYVPFVATFGILFDGCRNPSRLVSRIVFLEEVASTVFVVMLTNIRPTNADVCSHIAVFVLAVCGLHLGYILIVRPYANGIENAFSGVFALLQLASAIVAVISMPIDEATAAVDFLTLSQCALLILQPIALICHSRCESKVPATKAGSEQVVPLLLTPSRVETSPQPNLRSPNVDVVGNPLVSLPKR